MIHNYLGFPAAPLARPRRHAGGGARRQHVDPHTDWLPDAVARDSGGFVLTGPESPAAGSAHPWPLRRLPLGLETSVPGVFAAGDVRADSVKRVASAVGEGAVAVRLCQQYLSGLTLRQTA
jgi:thioredoxin reductase